MTPRTIQSLEFSRPEYRSGYDSVSPGHLPNPGIEPRSPALQVDSLPAEPQARSAHNLEVAGRHYRTRLDARDKCLDLVHWEDPEGSGGEGGGRGDRNGEYM